MLTKNHDFANPPVIEVVLGVQFEPLRMASGHLGWYWRDVLGGDWPNISDGPRLPDQIESFGERWGFHWPAMQFVLGPVTSPGRIQIRHRDDDRMIQVQDTRFVYNWIKSEREYPRYRVIRQEFDEHWARFCEFVRRAELGTLRPNQWEVTYVNHVPCGPLWSTPADADRVFPGLLKRPEPCGGTSFETMASEWRNEIPSERGRLHINARFQGVKRPDGASVNVLVLHLTARGSVNETQSLSAGLDLGHDIIVNTFVHISSDLARKSWGEP